MLLPLQRTRNAIARRQNQEDDTSSSTTVIVIIAIVSIVLVCIAVIIYALFRNTRRSKNNAQYLPGDTLLRKFGRWRKKESRGEYSAQLQPNPSAPSLIGQDGRRSRNTSREPSLDRGREQDPERGPLHNGDSHPSVDTTAAAGVDRNTSVRSVMTLPAYTPAARPTEQIIAREGERGGIDTVVEFPENGDEEEARRDEEMESLYQIRRARRQEQAEREERRRQRREARLRGDYETLQRLQLESRQRAESAASGQSSTSAALIAEHQAAAAARDRKVSSVQYAELGVARHDGSRIRGNSTDSDNRPLLDSAASISGMSLTQPSASHQRGRSASSVLSVSTANGSDDSRGTPRIDENGFEFISLETQTSHPSRSRASSDSRVSAHQNSGERDAADLGIRIPSEMPPQYDDLAENWGDAPPYTSPVTTHTSMGNLNLHASATSAGPPRLPSLASLPSIEVTNAVSPVTPTDARREAR